MKRLRILLTEGSSLSARQTLFALGAGRHILDVCDPRPWLCLARYSRYVRTIRRCPVFAVDPAGYLRFLIRRLRRDRPDVLLPVHDQAFLLARFREPLRRLTGLAVPDFEAFRQVQSKAGFVRLLHALRLPYPPTVMVRTRRELEQAWTGPCYVKLAHSTAGRGVWRIESAEQLRRVAEELEKSGLLNGSGEVLVQHPAVGNLCVVQSVFQHGRLVAGHCYAARALGVGGSARARVSVAHPHVLEHLARIGAALAWHGALMLDYFHDEATGQPAYIDANPRIGETLNATLSGVNLCEALVQVSLDQDVKAASPGRVGVRTHSVMMSLMAAAEQRGRRWPVLAELGRAGLRRGVYADSQDELTRPGEDVFSLLPAVVVAARLLINPRNAQHIVGGTVAHYALSEAAAQAILRLPTS